MKVILVIIFIQLFFHEVFSQNKLINGGNTIQEISVINMNETASHGNLIYPVSRNASNMVPCATKEDFTLTLDPCNTKSITLQTSAISGSYSTIKWEMGDGNTILNNPNPIHTYTQFGIYQVKMILLKAICEDTVTKLITVGINQANVVLTSDTSICMGQSKQLLTKPGSSYCWTPTTYLNNPLSASPIATPNADIMYFFTTETLGPNLISNGDFSLGNTGFTSEYVYANPNTVGGQYFVGPNANTWNPSLTNCPDHTSGNGNMLLVNGTDIPNKKVWTTTVNVLQNTNYVFSTWIQQVETPNPAKVQFSINGINIGPIINGPLPECTWKQFKTTWNSGNNTTANISVVNQNLILLGNDFALDDISFTTLSLEKDSVKIKVNSLPIVKTTNDTTICNNVPIQLNSTGAITYLWTPSIGLSANNIANPIASINIATNYIVTGTDINGCKAKDTVQINLFPKPLITKTSDTAICRNTGIQLSCTGGSSYLWSPATFLNNPTISNPYCLPLNSQKYYIQITDINNCSQMDSVVVSLKPAPLFSLTASKTILCKNDSLQFLASGGNQFIWQQVGNLNSNFISNPIGKPVATTNYSVQIISTTCNDTANLSKLITVNPLPVVSANKSNDIDCSIANAQLSGTGGVNYSWTPVNGLNNPNSSNPIASPSNTQNYIVKVTDSQGCSDTASVTVFVGATGNSLFLLPSVFTPNGDGVNDCFGILHWGNISVQEFSIFNRWGIKVFSTNNPSRCWDGTYKGIKQTNAAFVYQIRATSLCGEIYRKGTLILAR